MSSRKPKIFLLIISSILVFTLIEAFPGTDKKRPPETPRKEVREVLHGVEIVDPYRWLEDQNSPETRAWIDAQNAYTQSLLSDFPGREKLKKRLTELLKVDVINLPYRRGGRYFFTRRTANQNLAVIYMRHGLHGKDEVLIDPHKLSSDFSRSVQIRDVSQDGNLLVYGIRHGGEDEVILRFYDVKKHQNLPDSLPRARYFSISITPDNQGIFYTRHEKKGPRIYYHKIGSDYKKDRLIFGEGYDFSKIILSRLSNDGHYLLIHVLHGSAGKTDVFVKDLRHNGKMITVMEGVDARTFGYVGGDKLYLETNWQAPNHRIMVFNLESPPQSPDEWQEVIPEQSFPIQSFDLAGGKLFVHYLENVVSRLKIYNPDGTLDTEVHLPAMGSVSGIRARWESPEVFFVYSSFHIPTTIYRYEIETKRLEVWAKRNINIDTDNIEVKQVWYHSKDGTRIPMFLVHKKGLQPNEAIPTYLTGYGGFNISRRPGFSANTVLWVELGGLYALPNLRGGGEFGEKWHRAGMLEKKQNVFDDFIAAAEWLIKEGYTNPSKLAIAGGSNGGLLVGAALTQRPDLFKAVICAVPLLDMIRYHKFLVARFWIPEYGSSDDPEQFKYLLAYSPYHNVRKGTKYPAVLFITGDSDTRVAPLHARKMTALLQWATGSDNPILLYYDTKSGHSGGKPVSQQIEDATIMFSFLLWQLGVEIK